MFVKLQKGSSVCVISMCRSLFLALIHIASSTYVTLFVFINVMFTFYFCICCQFLCQIIGGAVLHDGSIAEMKTGEGKTLVSTLAAYLNALTGEGVHGMLLCWL